MKISRRVFFSALVFAGPAQTKSIEVAVIETFDLNDRTVAVLANHAEASLRQQFANWLRANPRATVRVHTPSGREAVAVMFRVRMCFGRALIVVREPLEVRKGDRLLVEWTQNGR